MIGFGLDAKYFITPNGRSLFYYLGFPTKTLRWQQLNEDIENLKEIDSMLNRPSTNSMEDLQDIQKKIFDHRKGCYTIPNCVYNIFKDNDEDNAHRALRN